jgi:hypothetical protein
VRLIALVLLMLLGCGGAPEKGLVLMDDAQVMVTEDAGPVCGPLDAMIVVAVAQELGSHPASATSFYLPDGMVFTASDYPAQDARAEALWQAWCRRIARTEPMANEWSDALVASIGGVR